jgi:hypothetical protein
VSPCNPPPKVLSQAGGSGLSRHCSLLADNDSPSLSALSAGIVLALVQRRSRVRVHFFYLQTLTPPRYQAAAGALQ